MLQDLDHGTNLDFTHSHCQWDTWAISGSESGPQDNSPAL